MRLEKSTPDLDAAERAWWDRYSAVEEEFCWVQTPPIQRFLRREYISHIVDASRHSNLTVELGCGSGWLLVLLAKEGAKNLVGVDFSRSQIDFARRRAKDAGVGDNVRFECISEPSEVRVAACDLILMHAFLHHLSVAEIERVVAHTEEFLSERGRLIVFEPVRYPGDPEAERGRRLVERINWLRGVPGRGMRRGFRSLSTRERDVRALLSEREVGVPPFGPAPKETPFDPGEIQRLMGPAFTLSAWKRCLCVSHEVAKELLLLRLSHPWRARVLMWPVLWLTRRLERELLSLERLPPLPWVFEMFEFRPVRKT